MNRVQPQSLGDAYPALCNFLKLTSLTLAAPQLALTVQVGDDWRHGGVMNYGHLPVAILREVLSSQPVPGAALDCKQLLLSTYSRSEGGSNAVLVGHLRSTNTRYQLTIYVPGLTVANLSEVQVKTLQYLAQQLLLCLTMAQPIGASPQPMPHSESLAIAPPSRLDLLSQVVALSPTSPTSDRLHQGHPRLVDLVAQLQACLSYRQLGQLLATYLPYFFPHQSGRLVLFSSPPETFTVLTEWGEAKPLTVVEEQCCYSQLQQSSQQPGISQECHQCQVSHCPTQVTKCIVLGMVNDTTCIVQLVQLDSEPFTTVQTELLKKLSEQILFVMQRLLLLEDLQDQAVKDPLTGLLNRRHAETVLNSLCHPGNRQQNISVILIDIDHFKAVNDTYGHQAGDTVLKNIGMLLRGHVRSQDIVYRYGGEEFCMVLLDTTPEVALKRAEKIRRAVKYVSNSFNGQVLPPLTISLGVASFPQHGETPQTLVTLADKALYWAKKHGRDRAVSVDHMLLGAECPRV
ncbi:GGDEF domain-containing protein [Nodosilinea sp. LEGE 06152]|uniref:GGDEF domain-containing protein n=1 Tax=Nodosilinea sp. LEGE 06152 TaxID=2777966 RepID=UPI0018820A32|nr:GGDEF domain-containing protein [Nodosilinea sp. LEGE 06152]MBE9155708.1 GGDEF domain-containing protein [Nodosilinea sp. LEGE 06152]